MTNRKCHIILGFLLAAGLLAGCTADTPEPSAPDDSQKEIRFKVSTASQTEATRVVTINNNVELTIENIRVDAYFHGTTIPLFSEALLRYRTFNSHFEFNTGPRNNWIRYYWPIGGSVHASAGTVSSIDFVGYVPYILQSSTEDIGTYAIPTNITLNAYSATNGPSFTATLPITTGSPNTFNETNQTSLREFMYAYAGNQTKDTNAGTVNLEFQHPFALINFYLKSAKRETTINSITLSNLKTSGTFTHAGVNAGWSGLGTDANLIKTVSKKVPDELNFNALIGGPYLVIPQDLTGPHE